MTSNRLQRMFFARDTQRVAKELLGKVLVRHVEKKILTARIVEVESYVGENDAASHASRGRTARTEIMFGEAGYAYVYLIYGMYHCLNIVTEEKDFPAAVLIRAAEPLTELAAMKTFRKSDEEKNVTNGPGKLCQALHITRALNGEDITTSKELYVVDDGFTVPQKKIVSAPRIGVDYAGADAQLPWRYYIRDNPFVSRP